MWAFALVLIAQIGQPWIGAIANSQTLYQHLTTSWTSRWSLRPWCFCSPIFFYPSLYWKGFMQMLRLCLCSEFFAKFARVCGNSWGCLCLISSFLCCRRRGFGRLLSFEWKENNFLSNPRASQKPAIPCYFPVINNPSQNLGRLIKRKEKKKNPVPPEPHWMAAFNCFLPTYRWGEPSRPSQQPSSLYSGSFQSEGGCQGNHRYQSPATPVIQSLIYIERISIPELSGFQHFTTLLNSGYSHLFLTGAGLPPAVVKVGSFAWTVHGATEIAYRINLVNWSLLRCDW